MERLAVNFGHCMLMVLMLLHRGGIHKRRVPQSGKLRVQSSRDRLKKRTFNYSAENDAIMDIFCTRTVNVCHFVLAEADAWMHQRQQLSASTTTCLSKAVPAEAATGERRVQRSRDRLKKGIFNALFC